MGAGTGTGCAGARISDAGRRRFGSITKRRENPPEEREMHTSFCGLLVGGNVEEGCRCFVVEPGLPRSNSYAGGLLN